MLGLNGLQFAQCGETPLFQLGALRKPCTVRYHNDGKAARSKFEGAKRVPATVSAIADAVRWAEGPLRPQSALRARFHQLTQGLRKSRGLLLTDTFASSEESVDPLVSNHR